MTISSRKFFHTAIAAVIFSSAALATAPSVSASELRRGGGHGYNGGGGGFNNGAAVGMGMFFLGSAIAAAAANQNAQPRHGTREKRCSQAKRWIKAALRAEANGDFEIANSRWRSANRARQDCNNW